MSSLASRLFLTSFFPLPGLMPARTLRAFNQEKPREILRRIVVGKRIS
jgi:hypothetical protein